MELTSREPIRRVSSASIDRRQFLRGAAGMSAALGVGLMAGCAQSPAPTPTTATVAKPAAAPTSAPQNAAPTQAPVAKPTAVAAATGSSATLTIGQGADLTSLDPHVVQATAPRGIVRSYMDSLLSFDENLKLIPWLAKSVQSVDPRTWAVSLRDDVVFHNGEKFTAAAVQFSINRFKDPATKNPFSSQLDPVDHVEIQDDYTLRIVTRTPFPSLPLNLATALFIGPPNAMQQMGADYLKKPIGSGPYRFVEYSPGEHLTVEAVEHHWSGAPSVGRLVWRTITDPTTRVTALRTGEVDLITGVPPTQVSAVNSGTSKTVQIGSISSLVLILNTTKGPLADKRVRQAINYAIDKDKIAKDLYQGAARPTTGAYSSGVEGYVSGGSQPYQYDPDKAKQLLTQAGLASGFSFHLDTPSGRYLNDQQLAQAAASDLHKVGIEMAVNPLEWGAMVKLLGEKTADATLLSVGNQDTNLNMSTYLSSKTKGLAWLGYANPELDSLIERAGQEIDDAKRQDLWVSAGKLTVDEAPWVFLVQLDDIYGVQNRVQNFKPRSDGVIYVPGINVNS